MAQHLMLMQQEIDLRQHHHAIDAPPRRQAARLRLRELRTQLAQMLILGRDRRGRVVAQRAIHVGQAPDQMPTHPGTSP